MTLRFVWEPWLVATVLVVLGGVCAWALLRDPAHRARWWRRLGLVLATVAIGATPAVVAETTEVTSRLALFIVVDRTGSMAAEDWDGGRPRLDGVRADVVALTEAFPGARYSVIGFDSQAVRQLPLTTDARAVVAWADTLHQEPTTSSTGSSLDRPVGLLGSVLSSAAERSPQDVRLVFLLADGEDTAQSTGPGIEGYRELRPLVDGGAVLGYGTAAGAPMRSWNGTTNPNQPYIVDRSQPGDPVAISRIDEANLRAAADALGVPYLHRATPGGLEALAAGVEAETVIEDGRATANVYRDLYWPFAWAAVVLLAWEAFEQVAALRQLRGIRARPS
jgi:von Willebrand factor type A domain.